MKKTFSFILFIFFLFSVMPDLSALDPVSIKRIAGHVDFDGKPGEKVWESLELFPLTMHKPNFGSEPSEKSEIRIGYDDEFLWIGAHLFMSDITKVYAATKKRDERLFGFDAFGVIIDSFKDNENGLAFFTTPTGIRTDYTISNDAVANGPGGMNTIMNYSWNTFWDVITTNDEKGWYVEMRIPFSSLKFKPQGDVATMGIIISRNISVNNETDTYPAIRPDNGFMSPYKPSLAQAITIEGARPKRPVYVSPYILGGLSRDFTLNETETEYVKKDNPEYTTGLDIKYNINSNLTLDLTTNTDFSQVESDALQVNLTRYSLFFPEKRKFFQERTSLFDFSLGGQSDNLFYSRNIGISNGNPVKIYGGARITGRLGKWDMGFLDMQTSGYDTIPGENFGVLRMRRQVINQNSYVGGIFTSRIGMNGHKNIAYGVDGIFRLFGEDYLNVKWSQTYDSQSGNNLKSMDPSFLLLDWERRSQKGFAYKLSYLYSGEQFHPGAGFVMRGGVQGLSGKVLYGWIPGDNSKLFSYNITVNAEQYNRIDDNKMESMKIAPVLNLITKSGYFTAFSVQFQKEGVRNDFNLSEKIVLKAGEYAFTSGQIMVGTPNTKKIALMSSINAGQFYNGRGYGAMNSLIFNLSSGFNLTAMYSYNNIRFPAGIGSNSLNIHSLNMTALVMFSTKLSASFMAQYINTQKDLITNFRIRYNPKEGNDFYLVINDYRKVADRYSIPESPSFFNETVTVKYAHTFIL